MKHKSSPNGTPCCKVALVVGSIPPVYAGGGLRFYAYAQRLARRGQLAFLLTHSSSEKSFCNFQSELAEQMIVRLPPKKGIEQGIWRTVCKLWWMFSLFISVGWLLLRRRRQYDVVHATGAAGVCLAAMFWAKVVGRSGVFEISLFGQDDPVTMRKNSGHLRYWLWSQSHAYVALSPQLCDTCQQEGIAEDRVYLIGSPADTVYFHPVDATRKYALRQQLRLPEKVPIIIFVGGILERKGADLLPAIFRGVLSVFPSAHLLLLGKDDWPPNIGCVAQMIRSELEDCLASGQLIFTGVVCNVHEYLQASDIFLFPSRREGLPHAPIEAMACGIPCVAHDIQNLTSFYIEDGVDGVIIHDENPAAYADAIIRLLSNESEYREMSARAHDKVMASFSADVIDRQYNEMYRKLVLR